MLTVRDKVGNNISGSPDSWTLRVYGHKPTPLSPSNVAVTDAVESLVVQWDEPPATRGTPVTRYDVLYRPVGGDEEIDEDVGIRDSDGTRQYHITRQTGSVEYNVRVRAGNDSGEGEWSEPVWGTPQRNTGLQCTLATGVSTGSPLETDCNTLLAMRDVLVGSGTPLNWSPSVDIGQRDGQIDVVGNRIIALEPPSESLAGRIPTTIGDLTGLRVLDLSDNSLTGSLPTQLEKLTSLTQLQLHGDNLSGGIATQLGELKATLTQLRLDGNNLSGSIPSALQDLTGLQYCRPSDRVRTALTAAVEVARDGLQVSSVDRRWRD